MVCRLAIEKEIAQHRSAITELELLLAEAGEGVRAPISNWAKIYVATRFYDAVQDLSERLKVLAELRADALALQGVIKQIQDPKGPMVQSGLGSQGSQGA